MESVAGVAIATETCQWCRPALLYRTGTLQYQISRTFTQIQPGPIAVEGTSLFMVENQQGIEAVQVELCQAFGTTGYNNVCQSASQHVGSGDDGICG